MQMIFQDPYASLNSRMTVGDIVGEPLSCTVSATAPSATSVCASCCDGGHQPNTPEPLPARVLRRPATTHRYARAPPSSPISSSATSRSAPLGSIGRRYQPAAGALASSASLTCSSRTTSPWCGTSPTGCGRSHLGRVELAANAELYGEPLHPYTQALLSAVPIPDPEAEERRRAVVLQGDVPSPADPPPGCHFHTRCPAMRKGLCDREDPALREARPGHFVACHLVTESDHPHQGREDDLAEVAG